MQVRGRARARTRIAIGATATTTTTNASSERDAARWIGPEADHVAHVRDEERGQPGNERVARQHQEHVAREREHECGDEPGAAVAGTGGGVERDRNDDQRDERRGLAQVFEAAIIARLAPPVAECEQRS